MKDWEKEIPIQVFSGALERLCDRRASKEDNRFVEWLEGRVLGMLSMLRMFNAISNEEAMMWEEAIYEWGYYDAR